MASFLYNQPLTTLAASLPQWLLRPTDDHDTSWNLNLLYPGSSDFISKEWKGKGKEKEEKGKEKGKGPEGKGQRLEKGTY